MITYGSFEDIRKELIDLADTLLEDLSDEVFEHMEAQASYEIICSECEEPLEIDFISVDPTSFEIEMQIRPHTCKEE